VKLATQQHAAIATTAVRLLRWSDIGGIQLDSCELGIEVCFAKLLYYCRVDD